MVTKYLNLKKIKRNESLAFKAELVSGDVNVFRVEPENGELLSDTDEGTLIKIGFTPPSYGKTFQAQLLIQVCLVIFLI